LKKEILILN